MNLANEISTFQSELESLRAEALALRNAKIVADFELDQLRRKVRQLEEERDRQRDKHSAIKTLLDSTGAAIVQGINKIHADERDREIAYDEARPLQITQDKEAAE